jgi:hypothetical protein
VYNGKRLPAEIGAILASVVGKLTKPTFEIRWAKGGRCAVAFLD